MNQSEWAATDALLLIESAKHDWFRYAVKVDLARTRLVCVFVGGCVVGTDHSGADEIALLADTDRARIKLGATIWTGRPVIGWKQSECASEIRPHVGVVEGLFEIERTLTFPVGHVVHALL